ncbi:MAG: hypothetical protein KJN77_06395 [Gammaproteobacteria bacterium]|nr:hypothetical protein [Gammaproteobacteria bacterium]
MSKFPGTLSPRVRKEALLFVALLFIGIVLLPVAVYLVGQAIFGAYAGAGYGDFFGTISAKLRGLDGVAWFLVLSPYLLWQCLRLTFFAWNRAGGAS